MTNWCTDWEIYVGKWLVYMLVYLILLKRMLACGRSRDELVIKRIMPSLG